MKHAQKVAEKYIVPIDEAELAVRMCEAACKLRRPNGATAIEALAGMDAETSQHWLRAARTAMVYWRECISGANRVC